MKEDFASVAKFIMKNVGEKANAKAYFENVKDGFYLPAIYFPEPEAIVRKELLTNQYSCSNSIFVQVFHLTNDDAYELANEIAEAFFKTGCYIPIINQDGSETSLFLHVNVKKVSRIDDCLAQVQLSWNYSNSYNNELVSSEKVNINLNLGG